jgi:uncharacterized OB-fold protein
MNQFEEGLKSGRFLVGECVRCKKITWPPSEFCNKCFGNLKWRKIIEPGVLIEFSSKDGKVFGIVEFEGTVRIMGTISNPEGIRSGSEVRVHRCGFEKTPQITFSVT